MGRVTSLIAGLALAGAVGLAATAQQSSKPFIGYATVVDGDTLRLDGQRIRLWGIDAPEARQVCTDASNRAWACGAAATSALQRMIAEGMVECHPRDRDRYSRIVADCSVGRKDLGSRMVALGLAVDYTRYSGGAYAHQQEAAKAERLGLWSGTFEMPETWRHQIGR